MRFNTYYVKIRKGRGETPWIAWCLRSDCDAGVLGLWPTHPAAMAAADAHVHFHETIGAASS